MDSEYVRPRISDFTRPSLFELIAADKFVSSLRPALEHVFSVLGPPGSRFSFLSTFKTENYYLLLYFLEKRYLEEHDGTFAENFFGLHRMRIKGGKSEPLGELDRRRALFTLVAVPYMKHRLDTYYAYLNSPIDLNGLPNQDYVGEGANITERLRNKHLFVKMFPYAHALYEGVFFLYQLRFMFDPNSRYFSPLQQLVGQVVQRMTMMQMNRRPAHAAPPVPSTSTSGIDPATLPLIARAAYYLAQGIGKVLSIVQRYGKWALLLFIVVYKLSELWNSPSNQLRASSRALPIPPAPPPLQRAPGGLPLSADKTLCSICRRTRTNAAAASSGYVFCYPCIHRYAEQFGRCPVTEVPCSVDQIRRVYES